ncbi:hypothetical protein PF004_g5156 [Phytophthora fragariae]|uniref:Uncharacterized protein n=1 Tax=Phytophthora fragariae TaxID=53985 RepID=A0A6G0PGE1_9STRA|nr:hypothetical protein PF004_g5156 [Phytophthora fragariae]
MMKLLASGASPDGDLSRSDNPYGCNETFFRFLARQSLELTDPTLACLVLKALVSLVLNTRKSPLVSQLCLAVLHQTFPSVPTPKLQDFLQDESEVNNVVLQAARAEWETAESVWSEYERRDVMLSDDKLVSACRTLQSSELTATILRDWRPAVSIDRDDDETDSESDDDHEGSQEFDEESLSEEEDEDDGFVVRSYAAASASGTAVPVLGGRKTPAVALQHNEDLGFPTIVVNFKKHKKHKS